MEILRFGILSTASINAYGFLPFAEKIESMEIAAIASRDDARATEYAGEHGIPRSYGSYEELIADPEIDCVYIPLPASMHAEWSIRALDAGKHVLCEKPVAMNEDETLEIKKKVEETGLIFAEAFHNRYHPLMEKTLELVNNGEIGDIRKIKASFCVPLTDFSKVQYKKELGGGALMDLGCYPVSFSRWVAGCDEAVVTKAGSVKVPGGGVDLTTKARLEFSNGIVAGIYCSMIQPLREIAFIRGSEGSVTFVQYIHPVQEIGNVHLGAYLLILINKSGLKNIRVDSKITYHHQLEAFCEAVRSGTEPITGASEAVANMKLLDAISEKASV